MSGVACPQANTISENKGCQDRLAPVFASARPWQTLLCGVIYSHMNNRKLGFRWRVGKQLLRTGYIDGITQISRVLIINQGTNCCMLPKAEIILYTISNQRCSVFRYMGAFWLAATVVGRQLHYACCDRYPQTWFYWHFNLSLLFTKLFIFA